MASSFFGLYVQREALLVAQKSLDVVGHNVSNINTKGYTRQRVDVASISNHKSGLMSNTAIPLAGQGVRGIGVTQLRDELYDKKYRTYTSDVMNVGIRVKVMSDVETALDNIESDVNGFNKVLSNFKASLQSFSADNANRQELASIAQYSSRSVVEYFNILNSRLDDISDQTFMDAKKVTERVNTILAEMGDLNKQISDAYVNMNYLTMQGDGYKVMNSYGPLELKDKMNLLLDELAEYGNIDFKEEYNGSFSVWFAGQQVVDNKYYAQVAVTDLSQDSLIPNPAAQEFIYTDVTNTYDPNGSIPVTDLYTYDAVTDTYNQYTGTYPPSPANTPLFTRANNPVYDTTGNAPPYIRNPAYYDAKPDPKNMGIVVSQYRMDTSEWKRAAPSPEERQRYVLDPSNSYTYRNADGLRVPGDKSTNIGNGTAEGVGYFLISGKNPVSGRMYLDAGSLRGYLDTYNGNGDYALTDDVSWDDNTAQGIEFYRSLLNSLAKTFADQFNSVFEGYTRTNPAYNAALAAANPNYDVPEFLTLRLFEYDETDFDNIASSLRLTQDWINEPILISKPYWYGVTDPADKADLDEFYELDNSWIMKMLGVFSTEHMYGSNDLDGNGIPDYRIEQLMTLEKFSQHIGDTLGTQVSDDMNIYETSDIMLRGIEDMRDAVMGVAIDEEGIDMMNYQKWYNAIARMTTALDEALDTLINRTGRVGL